MIPEFAQPLEQFFASLRLTFGAALSADAAHFELIPESISSDNQSSFTLSAVYALYDSSSGITPESALRRVAIELEQKGHPTGIAVVKAFVAIYAAIERPRACAIRKLNDLIASISLAELTEYLIAPFPPYPGSSAFEVGDFRIGPLDYDRLAYWCTRIRCDYFDRYPNRHKNAFSMQRGPISLGILDFGALPPIAVVDLKRILIDSYFNAITQGRYELFGIDLWKSQEILVAAGAPILKSKNLFLLRPTFISLFLKIGRSHQGYFCPLGAGVAIDFANADKRIPAVQAELQAGYGFFQLAKNSIGETLSTYCRFVARAREHASDGQASEAFLHYAIALDLLFGDKGASTRTVTRRTAICVFGETGVDYKAALDRLEGLYDLRSKYVHAGEAVAEEHVKEVSFVCSIVLHCLLRLHALSKDSTELQSIVYWHKQLDYMAGAIDAGRLLTDEELRSLGLKQI